MLILHVVDASHPDPEGQISAVRTVLADVPGVDDIPELVVLNKADIADRDVISRILRAEPDSIAVSAHSGEGIADLQARISDALPRPAIAIDLVVPYRRGDLVNRAHDDGDLDEVEHLPAGTRLVGRVDEQLAALLQAAAVE